MPVAKMRRSFYGVTNLNSLVAALRPDRVSVAGDHIDLSWHDRIEEEVLKPTIKAIQTHRTMGKLQEAAQRIKAKKLELENEADKILGRLSDIDKKGPTIFDRANKIVDGHNADLDAMDNELRQLSNLGE